jgi:hypothetical protein
LKGAVVAVTVGLAVLGAGAASLRALAEGPATAQHRDEDYLPRPTPAEVRVKQLKKQLNELTQELHRAEETARREKAVPPRNRPVAVIFGNVEITRDELAEHALSRLTSQQLSEYINRRILEHACKKEGIEVSAADVEAHVKATLAKANMTEQMLRDQALRQQKRTMQQWKDDVVRTELMLEKLSKRPPRVTEKDLRNEYVARYGEKVECDWVYLRATTREEAERILGRIRKGETTFEEEARRMRPQGNLPPLVVARHQDRYHGVQEEAFALRQGEISEVIDLARSGKGPRGSQPRFLILKCRRRIPADRDTKFEAVRDVLKCDLLQRQQNQNTTALFERLKSEAKARLLWVPPTPEE